MQLRRVALVHASATPGGGADRVTEHVVGVRSVASIHLNTFGAVVYVAGQAPIFIPSSNMRWGEILEPAAIEAPPPSLKAVDGGKRVKR